MTCSVLADLDFNGTAQTLEFTADVTPSTERVSISLYRDGVPEEEEGFVVLFGVTENVRDSRDSGFVNVVNGAVLISTSDGGKKHFLH